MTNYLIRFLPVFYLLQPGVPRRKTLRCGLKCGSVAETSAVRAFSKAVAMALALSALIASSVSAQPISRFSSDAAANRTVALRSVGLTNLRAEVYSRSALELFWDRAQGGPVISAHNVYMSNQLVSSRDGYSYFVSDLNSGQEYQFRVEAIGAEGAIVASQSITVKTNGDTQPQNDGDASDPSGESGVESDAGVSPPSNFRHTIYSRTVAELFWDAAPGEIVLRYELYLNGVFKMSTHGRSYFIPKFDPNSRYLYELYTVNEAGLRSEPRSVLLGSDGSEPMPILSDSSDAHYVATVEQDRYALTEGGDQLNIPITVQRRSGHNRSLRVTLDTSTSVGLDQLSYRFSPDVIAGGDTTSILRLRLNVAMAPIKQQSHVVTIALDDGNEVQRLRIDLDLSPINAPDVYLLAGQSNMEGSSLRGEKDAGIGGLDEQNGRILQLNVRQNNESIFSEPGLFVSEQANVSSPLFIPAEDPLHQPRWPGVSRKGGTAIGLGLTFAKSILGRTTQPIVLVPAAWSGAGFCDNDVAPVNWNVAGTDNPALGGTLLLDRAIFRLNLALENTGGIFRGILWHQGEADSNNPDCAATYKDNLVKMVARIRREAIPDRRGSSARGSDAAIPFIAGTMSRAREFAWFGEIKDQVDAAHRGISDSIPWSDYVNNDDLVPPAYPCGSGSCVHFGALALREMGARYSDALYRIFAR